MTDLILIADAARAVGMHPKMLRHYDALGLVQPARKDNRYRGYTEAQLEELRLVSAMRQINVPLGAISVILTQMRNPAEAAARATARMVEEEISRAEKAIAELWAKVKPAAGKGRAA